jgi:bacteriocin-like protein
MQSKAKRNEQPVEAKELAETKVVKGQDQSNLSDEELEKVSGGKVGIAETYVVTW